MFIFHDFYIFLFGIWLPRFILRQYFVLHVASHHTGWRKNIVCLVLFFFIQI